VVLVSPASYCLLLAGRLFVDASLELGMLFCGAVKRGPTSSLSASNALDLLAFQLSGSSVYQWKEAIGPSAQFLSLRLWQFAASVQDVGSMNAPWLRNRGKRSWLVCLRA